MLRRRSILPVQSEIIPNSAAPPMLVVRDYEGFTPATLEKVRRSSSAIPAGPRRQATFWMLTIPHASFVPYLPPGATWTRGQLERGEPSGYLHWQFVVSFSRKKSLAQLREIYGEFHCEPTGSSAANDYVWKEETRVPGTQFDLGAQPFRRNVPTDWESVWVLAQRGDLNAIPASVRVISYRTIRAITSDYAVPEAQLRRTLVYWGPTHTGKSHRAWKEAGNGAYIKNSRTKFWDGYQGQESAILDEFRGGIDISYLLTWLDSYPVRVEIKGSSTPLRVKSFWICSNIPPERWYPDLDYDTLEALLRRLIVTHMTERYVVPLADIVD